MEYLFLVLLFRCGLNEQEKALNERLICINDKTYMLIEHVGDTWFIRDISDKCLVN